MDWLNLGLAYTELLVGFFGLISVVYGLSAEKPVWALAGLLLCSLPFTIESITMIWAVAAIVSLLAMLLGKPGTRLAPG